MVRDYLTRSIAMVTLGLVALTSGCASHRAAHEPTSAHFGDEMDRIGRRFERLGRAASAGRWEFASYEAHELRENVEALEHASPPHDIAQTDLPRLAAAFLTDALDSLDSTVARQDSVAFADAFRAVSNGCNSCHQSVGRAFIEIPAEPDAAIPTLAPMHPERRRAETRLAGRTSGTN